MRQLLALVPLSFALGGCAASDYCQMVHADTCVSGVAYPTVEYSEPAPPFPDPPVRADAVSAHTIVNVTGDHNVVNISNYESGASVRVTYAPSARAFDPDAARTSLHSLDLSACALDGAGGAGHAKVTFSPAGDVSAVVIDAPRGLGQHAVTCIGSKLGTAHVPAFDGEPVTAGTVYHVS